MTTDLTNTDQRRIQAAKVTGKTQLPAVRLQLDTLRQQGILVDLNITGTSMFTKVASFNEVGFAQDGAKDARFNWIRPGMKFVIPEEPVKKLKTIESRMRQALEKHTREVKGFYPYRWMPYTAHAKWLEAWKALRDEFEALKAEIIENRDDYVDQVAEEYARVAVASWNSISAQGYAVVVVDGTEMDSETFIAYITEKAVALVPTAEEIRSKLHADYVTALAYTEEDIAADYARAEAIRSEQHTQAKLNEIKVGIEAERARAEAWMLSAAQREREAKIEAMVQAEAEHARQQLQSVTSPFAEVFTALRQQMSRDASEILSSIKKNGFVRGKVAERGRGLIELFDLMCTHDDTELRTRLIELKNQLGAKGTKQDDESRDVEAIANTLSEIMQLEAKATADLVAGPGRFSAIDV